MVWRMQACLSQELQKLFRYQHKALSIRQSTRYSPTCCVCGCSIRGIWQTVFLWEGCNRWLPANMRVTDETSATGAAILTGAVMDIELDLVDSIDGHPHEGVIKYNAELYRSDMVT